MQKSGRWFLLVAAAIGLALPALAQSAEPPTNAEPTPAAAPTIPGSAAAAATAAGANEEVGPGPLLEARKMLWTRIGQAKSEGIGTAAYVNAFKSLEDEVKAGKSADELRPRIESLARSLKDQLDRSKILKTQRPIPPTASQMAGGGPSGGGSSAPGKGGGGGLSAVLNGKDPNALIEKIKEKFGGEIPEGLKDQVLNSEKGRKLLEKLSH